jgi:hypothetical protein
MSTVPPRLGARAAALAAFALVASPATLFAQSTTDLFDVSQTTLTVTAHTDIIGGTNNNLPNSDAVYNIFGANNPHVEPTDGAIFVDTGFGFVDFNRSGANASAAVNTITLYTVGDGNVEDGNRGTRFFNLFADNDNDGFAEVGLVSLVNPVDNATANTYVVPRTTAGVFRAEFIPPTASGSRVIEMDATFDAGATEPVRFLNRRTLNASTNGAAGDEPAGLVTSVTASSALDVGGGPDDPREALGQAGGPVEPGSFLFADNTGGAGVNNTLTFNTGSPLTLAGLKVQGGANGASVGDPRRISLLELRADTDGDGDFTDEVALFSDADFADTGDAGPGFEQYTFADTTASAFQLTVQNQEGLGARLLEIDAILGIPEPGTLSLMALGGLGLLSRRRRA